MIPQSFRDMPRWWRDGPEWLDALPELVEEQCRRWGVTVDGAAMHGSNALVVPVVRAGGGFVLRLTPPGPDVVAQIGALRFWDGRGTVRLIDADADRGVMLLERLSPGTSLRDVPVVEAMPVLGALMRRLAVPAPPRTPSTGTAVARRMTALGQEWERCGRPFPAARLDEVLAIGERLSRRDESWAVDADLHSEQVLLGGRGDWTVVDPVLKRGDVDFDLARVLWTRLDEMTDIVGCFDAVVAAAGTQRDLSRDWVVFRTADYWLWGSAAGLTEDPQRCRRLMSAFD